ncbi:hypothetical protein B2J93_7782 [Marssonina coronariae]|uniref:Peptide hydrolase n=1 Tax=Diplocarpon coronariae TaxID=2795749 RepID=A0A218ZGE7_9HELO|nr:hypothetical protein B2J93_7782 [Marssonina coronariae]
MYLSSVRPAAFFALLSSVAAQHPDDPVQLQTRAPGFSESPMQPSQAMNYPQVIYHRDYEQNAYLSNLVGPMSWLKTLTEFRNRDYRSSHGFEAGKWLLELVQNITAPNPAIQVREFEHKFNQSSIIVTIPGKSNKFNVVIGTHYDTPSPTANDIEYRFAGANRDGSGVVTHLEALRVLVADRFKPKNTIEFHFYAGRHGGNLGSKAVLSSYAERTGKDHKVVAFLNQKMTGYAPISRIMVCDERGPRTGVHGELLQYTKNIVQVYNGHEARGDHECSERAGDYKSAFDYGIPSVHVAGDLLQPYYQNRIENPNDRYDDVNWFPVLRHVFFTISFVIEASYYG